MNTEQEIKQLTSLLQNLIEKMSNKKTSRLEELTDEIKKIPDLEHLFIDDSEKNYSFGDFFTEKLNHLQKCVLKTSKYIILEEYIDLYLTAHPETVDYQNHQGITALMIASLESGNKSTEKTVEILLKHGVNVNLQDEDGWSSLIFSMQNEYSTVGTVKILLENKANVNLCDNDGFTPLMHIFLKYSCEKTLEIVKLLLEYGADVNLQDQDGNTALFFAFINNYFSDTLMKQIDLLFEHDVNINLEKLKGDTLLSFVTERFRRNEQYMRKLFKMIIEKMEHCDVEIKGKKLIKYLYDNKIPKDLILITLDKGARFTDILDPDLKDLYDEWSKQ